MSSLPDEKIKCPATGFKRSCRKIVSGCDCPKYVCIRGKNPQSDEELDRWGCVDSFIPLLLIENSQQQRQTGAAVESFRNEMLASNEAARKMLLITLDAGAHRLALGGSHEQGDRSIR